MEVTPAKLPCFNSMKRPPAITDVETLLTDFSIASSPGSESDDAHRSGPFVLQVGERRFVTSVDTLTSQSAYFRALFSGRWTSNTGSSKLDADYFIDADGSTFEHILDYLRREILPIFHDIDKGHDDLLYAKVEEQAAYFQIPKLQTYLQQKLYLGTVHERWRIEQYYEPFDVLNTAHDSTWPPRQTKLHPLYVLEDVYQCPRGVWPHEGNPEDCREQCGRTYADGPEVYQPQHVLKVVLVEKWLHIMRAD